MGAAGEDSDDIGVGCIEARLGYLHEMIISCDSDQSMIWDREPEVASQFLRGLDEVRRIIDDLGEGQEELGCFGHDILQTGMSRLEEELVHVLVQNQQPVVPDHVSFRSTEDDSIVEDFSSSSFDEESIQGKIQSESSRGSEEYVVDMVHPDAILDLKSITRMMFLCNYDKECRQAYVSVRKDVLEECLSALRVERLSIEEVVQMDRSVLNSMIKRWNRALKVFVRVYLASERRLCNLIFGEGSTTGDYCFHESSKSSVLRLLTFGEAIAIGPRRPELLYRILDMYEGLSDLVVDLKFLFPEDSGSFVVAECDEVLFRLGGCVRGTFAEFKNAIRNNTSSTPFSSGGVHPLTKYVMNYIRTLADYGGTLDLLLNSKDESDGDRDRERSAPLAVQLQSVASILEENLEARSTLYNNSAIQNLFKMNNVCYMVQKVKDSDLRAILGDDWVRTYSRKFRLYAVIYERASWTSVLAFLKDEGVCSHGSNTPSRTVLKERFKSFNLAFEELYRTQTGWIIPNLELREDLKISISLRVIQAYRTFVGRYAGHLDGVRHRDNYIKYCPEDLEACLLDLFEGSPKVMHPPHRR